MNVPIIGKNKFEVHLAAGFALKTEPRDKKTCVVSYAIHRLAAWRYI